MNRGGRAMAHVADHLSIVELEERYRRCTDACSARHFQTIWLLAQGHTIEEVQLDNAGWHGPKNLPVPDGIRLVYQLPRSPELQPAERLWPLVDEPLVNKHFATIDDLDAAVAERCCFLLDAQDVIKSHTNFHWWPKSHNPT